MRGWWMLGVIASAEVARADVTVSMTPEVAVADRLSCPATAYEMDIALGSGGESLVTWLDARAYVPPTAIVAARIDATGASLDPAGIYVGDGNVDGHPAVAFDGTDYLVAWEQNGVHVARISGDGVLLDTTPISIPASPYTIATAGSAGQFLVVWNDNSYTVLASRIAADGTVLDPTPLVLGSGAFVRGGPSVIFDGTNYVVVWGGAGIQAARVSPSGTVIAPGQVDLVAQIVGGSPHPAIAFSGTEYLVTWDAGALYHMRVSTSMAPIGSPVSAYGAGSPPAIAWDGTHYAIALEQDNNFDPGVLTIVYVSATNVYEDIQHIALPGDAYYGEARLLFDGTRFLAGVLSGKTAAGIHIATDKTVLDTPPLVWSLARNDQQFPRIAADGSGGYLVSWVDSREDDEDASVYVARVGESGGLDGAGIRVDEPSDFGTGGTISLGRPRSAGSTSLAVWNHGLPSQLRAARISADGVVVDPGGFVLAEGVEVETGMVDIACTVATCLVAWQENSGFGIRGSRVDLASGTVIDTTPLNLGTGISPDVAATDDSFIATGGTFQVVPEQGAPRPIMLPPSEGLRSSALKWDGTHFLYVWSSGDGEQVLLRAIRLDHDGTLVGEPVLLATLDASVIVDVAHDGTEWVVTWYPWLFVTPETVQAARITADGVLLDPGGVTLATGAGVAATADGSDGRFVIIRSVTESATPARGTALAATWVSISGENPATGDGSDEPGEGDGCCDAGGRGSGTAFLVIVVGLALRRRRGRPTRPRYLPSGELSPAAMNAAQ